MAHTITWTQTHTITWTQKHIDFWTRQLLALTPIEAAYFATHGSKEQKEVIRKFLAKEKPNE